MKFASAYILTAFSATLALAQRVAIGAPADGTSVAAGSNITVEIDRPVGCIVHLLCYFIKNFPPEFALSINRSSCCDCTAELPIAVLFIAVRFSRLDSVHWQLFPHANSIHLK